MVADYGLELIPRDPMQGPSELYRFADGQGLGKIGFISPIARPFCEECNRLRLTAVGFLRSCLLEEDGVDLRSIIRDATLSPSEIAFRLREAFQVAAELKPQFHKARRPRSFSQIGG
jgi:cyclic pyranopterin phosphate synthase